MPFISWTHIRKIYCVLFALAFAGMLLVFYVFLRLDAFSNSVTFYEKMISYCLGGYTTYSGCFTQSDFKKIKIGMSAHNVILMLGSPISIVQGPNSNYYHYTSMKHDRTRWLKVVEIDNKTSSVLSIYDGLYIDP